MKFLIIRFSGIGELVLSTPVARCLKKQLPLAEVHYLLLPQYRQVIALNPYVDSIKEFRDMETCVKMIRAEKFDVIIDLQDDLQTKRIRQSVDITKCVYNKLSFRKFLFKRLKWNLMPGQHLVDRFMQTVKNWEVKNDGQGLDFFIPETEMVVEKDIPASHQLGYIAIVIGGKFHNKKLPVEKLREICIAIDHPIMLIGGKDDFDAGYQVSSVDPVKIYNACGKFSLNESADLLRKSRVVISHDTGLMHIAAALQKPVITVWGSTTPSFGATPYYGHSLSAKKIGGEEVQVHKLWCRPCTEEGLDHCPQGHFRCMKKISVEEVRRKVFGILKKDQNSNSLTEG